MSSIIRINSNRANAAKSTGPKTPEGKKAAAANAVHSTGPRTPEGKAHSAANSLKHGLLSKSIVTHDECSEAFDNAYAALVEELQPRTYLERRMVEVMHVDDWRRGRCWHFEQGQLSHALHAQEKLADPIADQENTEIPWMHTSLAFGKLSNTTNTVKTLRRYETGLSREFLRYLKTYEERRGKNAVFSKRTKAKAG